MIRRLKNKIKKIWETPVSDGDTASRSWTDEFNKHRNKKDIFRVCHAPFKSIRFEPKGIVRTCCYNVEVVLGRYPEMSLTQIWNSDEANLLREKISNNDLSMGCRLCGQQLANKEYSTVKLLQYDNLPDSINNYPVMLDFSLHNTCNLECVMCHGEFSSSIRSNREKLPPVPMLYDDNFVQQLEEFIPYARQFVFAGGEPFLIKVYYDIWERINRLSPESDIHIVTNGTILNERVKTILAAGKYHITMSIDSFQEKTYETIRVNASYKRVMENMQFFQEYCKQQNTEFAVNVCPIKENRFEIPEMVGFCNAHAIKLYLLNIVYPVGVSLHTLPLAELQTLHDNYAAYQFEQDTYISKHNLKQFEDLQNRIAALIQKKTTDTPDAQYTDGDKVMFEVYTDLLTEKADRFYQESGSDVVDARQKITEIGIHFKDSYVSKGRLKEMESISSERIVVMFRTLSHEELKEVIKTHIL